MGQISNLHFKTVCALGSTLFSHHAIARSSDGGGAFFFFFLIGAIALWVFCLTRIEKGVDKKLTERKAEIEAKEAKERSITKQQAENERAQIEALFQHKQKLLTDTMSALNVSHVQGRQWLAEFIAEALQAPDEAKARALETKKRPALKAAEEVRQISAEKRALVVRLKYLEYALKTYHEYYPVLEQYHEDILNDEASLHLDEDSDPEGDYVARYISKEEYLRLSPADRNQLALKNWKARRKSNVEIGRIFERYIGYLYECDGWTVTYFGATEGLEDMGRDLICIKGNSLHIVQAKYWAKHKTIHEKHVFQLYGTSVLLPLTKSESKGMRITPVFVATTSLSETARWAAEHLGVVIRPLDMDHNYPLIKCNINGKSKIYHLPFDQQYDRVRIKPELGELYAQTAHEAEQHGFKRAKRHVNFS
ncbi:MAG: hypothetical protein K2Q19_07085 [Rhodocyclaceae bacterium]|nr:hypothetical protein [Rhodocyclaceae bacterium]